MARLTSTESTIVDLVALRNYHFQASVDSDRAPDMRRWHRSQVRHISKKLDERWKRPRDLVKLALIEFLAQEFRAQLHARAGALAPFAWEKFCEATRKELARGGRRSP